MILLGKARPNIYSTKRSTAVSRLMGFATGCGRACGTYRKSLPAGTLQRIASVNASKPKNTRCFNSPHGDG